MSNKVTLADALRERDALLILLDGAERQTRQRDINQAALNSRAQHDALQVRVSMRQSEVDTARPDILSQDAERFKRSADQSERLFRERQMNITVLRSRLEEAEGAKVATAKTLCRRIKEGKLKQGFTVRDVVRKCWTGLSTPLQAEAALLILEEHHYLKSYESTNVAGRPTTQYDIHPVLIGDRA